jgi:hypothetical protein
MGVQLADTSCVQFCTIFVERCMHAGVASAAGCRATAVFACLGGITPCVHVAKLLYDGFFGRQRVLHTSTCILLVSGDLV